MKSSKLKVKDDEVLIDSNHSFICPKCGGNMIFDVELTHMLPTMYHHKCDSCDYHKNLYDKNCDKRFNSVDKAKSFLDKNNIPTMTGAEMIKKMSDGQIIKFAEFLYYM